MMLEEPATIASERLALVWMSPAFMEASLAGRSRDAETAIAACLPPAEHVRRVMAMRIKQIEEAPAEAPWLLRAIVRREDRVVVGYINCHVSRRA